jgi:hypothetical protein
MFNIFLKSCRPILARNYGEAFAEEVLDDARREYKQIRPEIPNIGGFRNVFQIIMTVNGWIVALHKAMCQGGHGPKDTIRVCHEVFDGWFRRLPYFALQTVGRLMLSEPVRKYFESQARRSQDRRYAEDFVWKVERGPDGEMSLVFDECAVNKWYETQNVPDLKPYCNFADVTYSRLMGMGIDATQTIGLGCDKCALRYKRGRETTIPKNLEDIIVRM